MAMPQRDDTIEAIKRRALTDSIRNPQGLSVVNIRYCQRFYDLYSSLPNLPQLVALGYEFDRVGAGRCLA